MSSYFRQQSRPAAKLVLWGAAAALAAILFWSWYSDLAIPRPYPTDYTNFWWGWLHGTLILPTFVVSLFSDDVTLYQSPNNNWYDFGFVAGVNGWLFTIVGYWANRKEARRQARVDANMRQFVLAVLKRT